MCSALYMQDLIGLTTATLSFCCHRWQNGLVCPSPKSGVAGSNPTRAENLFADFILLFQVEFKISLSPPPQALTFFRHDGMVNMFAPMSEIQVLNNF
jgi:hypothetical protein